MAKNYSDAELDVRRKEIVTVANEMLNIFRNRDRVEAINVNTINDVLIGKVNRAQKENLFRSFRDKTDNFSEDLLKKLVDQEKNMDNEFHKRNSVKSKLVELFTEISHLQELDAYKKVHPTRSTHVYDFTTKIQKLYKIVGSTPNTIGTKATGMQSSEATAQRAGTATRPSVRNATGLKTAPTTVTSTKASGAKTTGMKTATVKASGTKTTSMKTPTAKASSSKTTGMRAATTTAKASGTKTTDMKTPTPKASGTKTTGMKTPTATVKASGTKTTGMRTATAKASGTKTTGMRTATATAKASGTKTTGMKTPTARTSSVKTPTARTSSVKTSGVKTMGVKTARGKMSQTKTAATKAS